MKATLGLLTYAVGLHVHTGSIHKFRDATYLVNSLCRYVPCFATLAANSPVWGLESELLHLPHSVPQLRLNKLEELGYIKVDNNPKEGALYSIARHTTQ